MVEEEKLKLYNAQAEVEVISACINDTNIYEYVREELSKELFTDYDCQKTYLIMRQLDSEGKAPDLIEMGGLLTKNNVNIGKFITTGVASSEITRQRIMHLQDLSILAPRETGGASGGSGVIGTLEAPMEAAAIIAKLKETFQVACVQTNQLLRRPIRRVGLCGGAGAFLLGDAMAAGADAFITGEMHYHDFFDHEQEVQVCVIGHYESEQYTTEIFKQVIEERCPGVRCVLTDVHTNPIVYM